jgi:O-acetyl-ADP-ribose deacetylase (regulator of RNase III)
MPVGSISLVIGDITTIAAEAIVNAANKTLLAGGGVCGAIHMAAGFALEEECLKLGGCPTGEAKITKGYDLPAKFVIHAVGPKYWDGTRNEAVLLRNCYKAIFRIAKEHQISSVAIPAIGTGIYRFPIDEATAIAVDEATAAIESEDIAVIFCCFDKTTLSTYNTAIKRRGR